MDRGDAAALSLFVFALVVAFLSALAGSALALATRARSSEEAGEGWGGSRSLLWVLARADRALPTLTAYRYLFNGIALASLTYLLTPSGRVAWIPLTAALLGLVVLLKALPHLAYQMAHRSPDALARGLAPGVLPLVWLVGPATALAQRAIRPVLSPLAAASHGEHEPLSSEPSIRIPVDEAMNPPDEQELWMIRAILDMEQQTAREVMVPRVDLVAVAVEEPVTQAAALMATSGHRRILVYEGTIDQVLGILHARDLLPLVGQPASSPTVRDLVRPATFVPETKRLDELMLEFLRQHVHIAVVVDEYGGTAGLVTLADVWEEIVGEIVDEFHHQEPEVEVISENEVVLDARVNLDYLRERFAMDVAADGFDTVGGLVYSQLGKIPNPGDEVTAAGLKMQVLSTLGKRIKRVRVVRVSSEGDGA